jgi:hypothetical protein
MNRFSEFQIDDAMPVLAIGDTSAHAALALLKRIKATNDRTEIRHLTDRLQRVIFIDNIRTQVLRMVVPSSIAQHCGVHRRTDRNAQTQKATAAEGLGSSRQPLSRGLISAEDFLELKYWVESDPDVPNGERYKRFKTGILAGCGETASTFLAPGMAVKGEEVK